MGPLWIVLIALGIIVHLTCGFLHARIWWEEWKDRFVYTANDNDIPWITLLSLILGIFAILGRLFVWKVAPKLINWFKEIPNLKDHLDI